MNIKIRNLTIAFACLLFPTLAQAQLTYTTAGGAVTITGYNTAAGLNLAIPATINSYPVTTIADNAFYQSLITNVTIPNSVIIIGQAAFYDSPLATVIIPHSVTSLGEQAFDFCTNLTSVLIPDSVTNLGNSAFGQCFRLTNITVNASNSAYTSVNGVVFDKAEETLLEFPAGLNGNYAIPSGVTSIGEEAFQSCSLTTVIIPDSVTNIGTQAFFYCSSLTNVIIGNGVSTFGRAAFYGSGLTSVAFPDSVTSIGALAFALCGGLTNIVIPNSVTDIGHQAFDSCYSLETVIIPNSVTNIESGAFYSCSGLTNLTIGNGVSSIGVLAFAYCSGLKSVTIPTSVTNIGSWAFDYCSSLTSAYFLGNASANYGSEVFARPTTAYYLLGATGWASTFDFVPTAVWHPQATIPTLISNHFSFNFTGPAGATVIVQASANLTNPIWLPIATNTISSASVSTFTDPASAALPSRYYVLVAP